MTPASFAVAALLSLAPPAPTAHHGDLGWEAFGIPAEAVPELNDLARRHVTIEGRGQVDPVIVFRVLLGFTPARREELAKMINLFHVRGQEGRSGRAFAPELVHEIARMPRDKDWHLHRELIDRCAARAREAKQPPTPGIALLHFTIDAKGAVTDAAVPRSNVGSAAFDGCLAEVVRTMTFPRPANAAPVAVSYRAVLRKGFRSRLPDDESRRVHDVFVDGFGLTAPQVADELTAHGIDLRACRDRLPDVFPGDVALVSTTFTIARDGAVSQVAIKGAKEHPDLVTCVADTLRSIRFPRPSDGEPVVVQYPIAFPKRK